MVLSIRRGLSALFVPLAACVGLAIAPFSAAAQDVQETFGDWSKSCAANDAGNTECFIFQNINNKESNKRMLHLTVVRLPEAERPILVMTVPLGVLLPPGLEITVDGGNASRLPVQICAPQGCQSQVQFSETLLGAFRAGVNGNVKMRSPTGEEVNVPFSLKGFTAALNSLG